MTTKYITTPIYYVNDVPHIGHAYTSIATDVWARAQRLQGFDTFFATGTDEHGQKIAKSAEKKGVSPQVFVDELSVAFRDLTGISNLSNDAFIRTTDEAHKKAAADMWARLQARGDIYLDTYAGWYAVRDEAFYTEAELVDGKAPTGAEVVWMEEESYFFKLSAYQDKLLALFEAHPKFVQPASRLNEVMQFVKSGLKDLCVSRSTCPWGIEVPGNPDHVMYVWLDALTNYLSVLGYPETTDNYPHFWSDHSEVYHVIGKDILRFHAVYWPAFLMAAGLPLPTGVVAHGWWTNEGEKISKSLGNTIDPVELIEDFGADGVRYFLLREVPFGKDGDFSKSQLISRLNVDLANDFGNLCQRVLAFIYKHCDGTVPAIDKTLLTDEDRAFLAESLMVYDQSISELNQFQFHKSLMAIQSLVGAANRYVDHQAPWALRKTDTDRMQVVLAVLAEIIRRCGLLYIPFMPKTSATLLAYLGQPTDGDIWADYKAHKMGGVAIEAPTPLFAKYEA
jgi:methionyl-tRNA synthetase